MHHASRRSLPPNLPGWDNMSVVKFFADCFGVPVHLQNDANACAYAEWKFGAGLSENIGDYAALAVANM